jgi:hypothetical protein
MADAPSAHPGAFGISLETACRKLLFKNLLGNGSAKTASPEELLPQK